MNLPFFGKFSATKAHMLKGKTLQNWAKWYKADRPIAGNGIREAASPQGRVWHAAIGVAATPCILGELTADTANAGKFKIEPGYIHGGGTNIFLTKDNITAAIGQHLYIEASWTAAKEDDYLLPGGILTAAVIKKGSSSSLDDDDFTPTSLTGKHRRALGTWIDDGNGNPKWKPDGCGSYNVSFCSNGKTGEFKGFRGDGN